MLPNSTQLGKTKKTNFGDRHNVHTGVRATSVSLCVCLVGLV